MLPETFLKRMQQMLGEEYGDFLETFSQERHQALRLNVLKLRENGQNAAWVLGTETQGSETDEVEVREPNISEAETREPKISERKTSVGETLEAEADHSGRESQTVWKMHLSKVAWAENGYYYEAGDFPGRHPYHEAGLYYIQEPSAMIPVELLEPQPGERVLDLCAAPGGKSTQIAAKMRGEGILFCNEVNPARAKILSENIERMGIGNACVINEMPERLADFFPVYFDRILVDAPCSGEGMFRKNEAACEEWSPENVAMCADRQDEILDCAARMLRPGGRLVYSTCTFAPEENEGSISRFLHRHTEFKIVSISSSEKQRCGLTVSDGRPEYLDDPVPGLEGTVRLWPHHIKGEGHYAAVLQKAGESSRQAAGMLWETGTAKMQNTEARRTEYGSLDIIRKVPEDFAAFVYENLRFSVIGEKNTQHKISGKDDTTLPGKENRVLTGKGRTTQPGKRNMTQSDMDHMVCGIGEMTGLAGKLQMIGFGDNLYLVPAEMPSLKGVKVLRPGLHLGELRKNRFEPSHALALALMPSRAVHRWNMDSDGEMIRSYLNGETFQAEGEKGWYLICVDGFSIGWGKLAGGMMKNHYPKGLRGKSH